MKAERLVDIDGRALLRILGWTAALLILWYARHVVVLVVAGIMFAVFLDRIARALGRLLHCPRGVALAFVVTTILLLLVAVFWLRGARIASQAEELSDQLPMALQTISQRWANNPVAQWVTHHVSPSTLLGRAGGVISSQLSSAAGGLFGAVFTTFLIVFITLALAATPNVYRRGFMLLFPPGRHAEVRKVMSAAASTLWWWLLGRLLSMTFVGVATAVGLLLLGVPLAFVLGLIAALLSFIPNFGPVISAIPAILLAAMQEPRRALYVIALYVGVQACENYLLDPIIDRKTVYLPPALTVVAQLLLATAMGVLGAAFAAPLTAAMMVITQKVYVQGLLGNREVAVED